MLTKVKQTISNNLSNWYGWCTNRKILVIESDDWGSIRMPSKIVYNKLLEKGIHVDKCPYNRYDSLANESDLEALFGILHKFQDEGGNHPVITANTVVANPCFEKIKTSGFNEYIYEPFTATLSRYPQHQKAFDFWQLGMKEKVFYPQFHGREHLNISLWLKLLRAEHPIFRHAFDLGLWGLGNNIVDTGRINIQAAFDASDETELIQHQAIIQDGLNLFEKIFGYKSISFIANNFIWDSNINTTLAENGISIIQGMKYQLLPLYGSPKRKMVRHYSGEKNILEQVFLVRNCIFEPSQYPSKDNVSSCLKDIENAFFWRKPAIISSHRLNYIGYIDIKNRDKNLISLENLIVKILRNWPNVEFMTTSDLGTLMVNDQVFNR